MTALSQTSFGNECDENSTHIKNEYYESVNELRSIYGLPPITENSKPEILRQLKGILEQFADEESSVDAIKSYRANLC